MNTQERIKEIVTSHPVVLFMKGTPQFPQNTVVKSSTVAVTCCSCCSRGLCGVVFAP